MPKRMTYNAVFLKVNGDEIILDNFTTEELKQQLELLLKQHYNIEYKFLPYGVYDLRNRRQRISKFIRAIIPHCEINDNPH
jgi:hypothetical protein